MGEEGSEPKQEPENRSLCTGKLVGIACAEDYVINWEIDV